MPCAFLKHSTNLWWVFWFVRSDSFSIILIYLNVIGITISKLLIGTALDYIYQCAFRLSFGRICAPASPSKEGP